MRWLIAAFAGPGVLLLWLPLWALVDRRVCGVCAESRLRTFTAEGVSPPVRGKRCAPSTVICCGGVIPSTRHHIHLFGGLGLKLNAIHPEDAFDIRFFVCKLA